MSVALRPLSLVCCLLIAFSLTGCGGGTTRLFTKPIAESGYVTYQEWGPNRDVAVMPFDNVAKDKDAGVKVRELFVTGLYASGTFKDIVDEGEMFEVMKKLKLRETDNFSKDAIKTLGDNLGVGAIIFGTVVEYNERSAKGALFAVSIRMVDVETGQILWLGNASKEGGGSVSEALGLSDGPTVIEVARSVLENLIDDLAGEVKHRRVKGKRQDETAVSKSPAHKATIGKTQDGGGADAGKQAGASPSPAVKGSAAGINSLPALNGGN